MAHVRNGARLPLSNVPNLCFSEFRDTIVMEVGRGARVASLFGIPLKEGKCRLYAVLTSPTGSELGVATTDIHDEYEALTPHCQQVHLFEREIAEQCNVKPVGHPWLKPVRFPHGDIGITDFFRVEGEEIHDVAVGPVHAGVIEPGHFRFQCHGENVMHLEISLGYQHRGVENALKGGPTPRTIHYMETLAGDTTVGHATAYALNMEALSHCRVPLRGLIFRSVALELERLANHTGDLGALAGDVGYLPVASHCGRIRGDFLNLTALLCGSRLGRGLVRPGGVAFDFNDEQVKVFMLKLERAFADMREVAELLWGALSVIGRFEATGTLSATLCQELGLVGPPARAAGIEIDTRLDYPSDIFQFTQIPVSLWHTGDVFGRAYVRWLEITRSVEFIQAQMTGLHGGPIHTPIGELEPDSLSIALVEGWRGEICHIACVGADRRLQWYKVIDPSFHNWIGLAVAMRNQQVSDFPLCNKSFNLSYCGHDL